MEIQVQPWVERLLWRREWLPTPVFFPGESHGPRSLVSCSQWGYKSQTQVSDPASSMHATFSPVPMEGGILPFPECHMVEIIQYVGFSHWFLSLSSMLLRSLHVFLWLDRSFLVVKSESAQSCPTLLDPMDCSPPGSSVHGILQARILEWVAISFSRGSSRPRIESVSPALQADSLLSIPQGRP